VPHPASWSEAHYPAARAAERFDDEDDDDHDDERK